ncbi:hypothetical protein HRH25_23800 [Flavisolibacter sp. BT320]|nr:hypothetical protein [Flavisolibacter longurius]
MTSLARLDFEALEKKSIKEYFQTIETTLNADNPADELTHLFTDKPFADTKPYLTRRKLIPNDIRFEQIELVYETPKKVKAIVWDLKILLSQLVDIFGKPIIHNEPYSDSTAFAFKSDNPHIEIIKTRPPQWLTQLKDKNGYSYQEGNQRIELVDPEFPLFNLALLLYHTWANIGLLLCWLTIRIIIICFAYQQQFQPTLRY